MQMILDFSLNQLSSLLKDWGEAGYRGKQIWQGLYRRLALSPQEMTDLPASLRQRLGQELLFQPLQPQAIMKSKDGRAEKTLAALQDGQSLELVLMRYKRRRTGCISTQVGCAMGCVFCATGQMGFQRNLTSGEIVAQVLYLARRLKGKEAPLSNVVLMGMGEPFHNYRASMQAIERLNDPEGFNFGARRFTISTVGLVPQIQRFTSEGRQVNLAVSLHAATNELRDRLLPINRRYPLESLIPACRAYVEKTGRRITFEWALIHGINDGIDQARALSALIRGLHCQVNFIPLNPTPGYGASACPRACVTALANELAERGIPTTIRLRRGIDIQAGCGQLAARLARDDHRS